MKMKLGIKLIISFLIVLALTAYIGISGLNGQSRIHENAKIIAESKLGQTRILGAMNRQNADYRIYLLDYVLAAVRNDKAGAADFELKMEDAATVFEKNYPEIEPLILTATGKGMFENVKKAWTELRAADQQVILAAKQGDHDKAADLLLGDSRTKYNNSTKTIEDFVSFNKAEIDKLVAANEDAYATNRIVSLIILTIALVLGIGLAVYISNGISKPAALVAETALRVAEGDLTVEQLNVKTKDEIKDMADAFNKMVGNLRTVVREIGGASQTVAATSEEMSATAEEASNATTSVASAIQEVAKGSNEQARSINESVLVMEQVARSVEQIAGGAQEQSKNAVETNSLVEDMVAKIDSMAEGIQVVKQAAERNGEVAETGGRDVEKTINGMVNVKKAVFDTARRIQELGEQSHKIGEIIQVIDDIAEQTNLLALNAAIEAARAGEHGKGFAVVADEVRKLAERSGKATKEIADLITAVQRDTEIAVESMEVGTKEVEDGVVIAQKAGDSLKEIVSSVHEAGKQVSNIVSLLDGIMASSQGVLKAITNVAAVTEENTAATEEISGAIREVDSSIQTVSQISGESAAAAEQVSASTEELTASVEQIAASSQQLAEMAQELQNTVNQFRV